MGLYVVMVQIIRFPAFGSRSWPESLAFCPLAFRFPFKMAPWIRRGLTSWIAHGSLMDRLWIAPNLLKMSGAGSEFSSVSRTHKMRFRVPSDRLTGAPVCTGALFS